MPDIVDAGTRSRMMRGIRSRDTGPELAVRRYLHGRGLRYGLHGSGLPGRPDIVLTRYRAIVMVHGCFWHRHPGCRFAYQPKSNAEFWDKKLKANADRDLAVAQSLHDRGWAVHVVWECEVRDPAVLAELVSAIRAGGPTGAPQGSAQGLANE